MLEGCNIVLIFSAVIAFALFLVQEIYEEYFDKSKRTSFDCPKPKKEMQDG